MSISMFFSHQKKAVKVCLAALSFVVAPMLFGQSDLGSEPILHQAPLNPAFVKWQEKQKERAARIALGLPVEPVDRRFGYIPDPLMPPAPNAPLTQTEAMIKSGLAYLPEIYDPRQYPTPVIRDIVIAPGILELNDPITYLPSGLPSGIFTARNQGQYGTCWSFSSLAALEYSLVKAGTPRELSEWHLAYFAYNPINGIPGFTKDSVDPGEHETFDLGGNFTRAVTIMTRGDKAGGPVERAATIYGGPLPTGNEASVATIRKTYFVSSADVAAIKGLVSEYGVVAISMMWPDSNINTYYNSAANNWAFRYVQGSETKTNHGVNIVGWDDNWARTKFPAGNQPDSNGAWIVRNSWGANWGDAGYFYMSYDTSIVSIGVYEGFAGADAKTYQYDMLGRTHSIGYGNPTAWFSNIFTADGNHSIKAVAFYTSKPGATYNIYIRKGVGSTPASGTLTHGPQSGTLGGPGYHRIDLNSPVIVSNGEKFAVIVKLTDQGYNYPVGFSQVTDDTGNATATPGVGFISSNGSSWSDITYDDKQPRPTASICLKAFADVAYDVPVSVTGVSLNKSSTTLTVGGTETLVATVLPDNATNKNVTWSSSNTSVATVSSTGLVSAIAPGTATITATSQADSNKYDTCAVTVNPAIVVSVSPKTAELTTGGTQTFTATVTGTTNTTVTWTASDGSITQSGVYTAPATAGTYTITATSHVDSAKSDTATATVTAAPVVSVSVLPKTAELTTGGTQTFTATVTGTTNTTVTWSASDGSITQSGVYTAPATAGTYTITATSQADSAKSGTAAVTVTMPTTATVSIINPPGGLFSGGTHNFNASVTGLSNTAVTWSASAGIMTPQGVFTAPVTAQTVTITVASVQEPSIRTSVQVKISVSNFDGNTKTAPQLLELANAFGSTAQADLDKYDFNGDGVIDDKDLLMLFNEMGW